jgi:mRNA-degrading endonuclease toxin of MazEF toxin-antitoxin module
MQKTRPALILQNDTSNAHSSVTIIAPLTTQGIERCYPNEALITATTAACRAPRRSSSTISAALISDVCSSASGASRRQSSTASMQP